MNRKGGFGNKVNKLESSKPLYTTWYEFRKDLGNRLGHVPLNRQWLEVKPRKPLPWDKADMQDALTTLHRHPEFVPKG